MQGVIYRCFFGDRCLINMNTRNRCKACRFHRCVQQGMSMDSVRLGRIPKNIKEKALRDHHIYQEKKQCASVDENCIRTIESISLTSSANDESRNIIVISPGMCF